MEKNTTTRRTVQLLTQHQAADYTHTRARTDTRKVRHSEEIIAVELQTTTHKQTQLHLTPLNISCFCAVM